MIWNKWCGIPTQPAGKTQNIRFAHGAGSGMPFPRVATQCQIIRGAPFGRGVKRQFALLRLLTRAGPLTARRVARLTASRLA